MLCFLAWNWVLKKLGAVVATNYVYFNPVTTILFAWAILSEQITIYFLLGTALILLGMFLADRGKSKLAGTIFVIKLENWKEGSQVQNLKQA